MVELPTSSIISSHPRKKGGNLFPACDTPPSNYFNMAAKRPPGTPGKIISWFRNFLVGVRTKYDSIDLDTCLSLFVSLNYSFFLNVLFCSQRSVAASPWLRTTDVCSTRYVTVSV